MCGFIGQISEKPIEDKTSFIEKFKKATNVIDYRGPSSDGYFHDEYCSLGFRRLSIIDVEGGTQPIHYDNDRYILIFNGEIYNYLEIREELEEKGYKFDTSSDSEVLVAAYCAYGTECLKKFRGMFGFIIWDKEEKTFFGARDMFGIKPMFYATEGDNLYIASEKKSILEMAEFKEVDEEALQYYFAYRYVPEPMTLTKGIKKLPAGHYFLKKPGEELIIKEFWDAEFSKDYYKTEDEAVEAIRKVLDDSMKFHIRSDVPVGALLSSGIDSTITTAIAKNYCDDGKIKTFTIGFDVGEKNETPIAEASAKEMGLENYAITVNAKEYMDILPKLTWHMDDPLADPSAVALYFVTKKASEYVTVIISGEGSDELFSGYKMYRQPISLGWAKYVPCKNVLRKIAEKIPNMPGRNAFVNAMTPIEERYTSNTHAFEHQSQIKKLMKNYDEKICPKNLVKDYYKKCEGLCDTTRMQYVDIKMWMTGDILLKADRMSMANSLELRVPFLDKEVFNVAAKINPKWSLTGNTTKRVLRKAARGIIPDAVLDRPKLGFPVPMADWLRGDMKDWAMNVIETSKTDKYINKEYVKELYDKHLSKEADLKAELWSIITFMLWHKEFIEK